MGKLQKYAVKSSVMDVHLILGDETFSFNLTEELQISEERINQETLTQSSSFAFLSMLHKKLIKSAKDSEMEAKAVRAQQYLNWKQDINPETGRPYSDDMANAFAEVSKKYKEALATYSKNQEKCNIIETCVKAFEMRASLIQTLSANIRKNN